MQKDSKFKTFYDIFFILFCNLIIPSFQKHSFWCSNFLYNNNIKCNTFEVNEIQVKFHHLSWLSIMMFWNLNIQWIGTKYLIYRWATSIMKKCIIMQINYIVRLSLTRLVEHGEEFYFIFIDQSIDYGIG